MLITKEVSGLCRRHMNYSASHRQEPAAMPCQNTALALCFGVPACGKTSLLKRLAVRRNNPKDPSDSCTDNIYELCDISIVCLSYDDIVRLDEQQRLVNEGAWKKCRLSIFKAFEVFMSKKTHTPTQQEHLSNLEHQISQRILNNIADSLATNAKNIVFVIEDNFYYHSMRYQWYQLARQFGMGFCQIYVECTLQTALKRNSNRSNQLDETMIRNIATKFEKPDAEKNPWEKYTLHLSENWGEEALEACVKLFKLSLENPVSPIPNDDVVKELSRLETASSLIHQIDQHLRKIVATIIQETKHSGSTDIRGLSRDLNEARKCLLANIKEAKVEIPNELLYSLKNIEESNRDVVKLYLQECLKEELHRYQFGSSK